MQTLGVRTDLALEAHDALRAQTGQEIPGVIVDRQNFAHGLVTTVEIVDEYGEAVMGRPKGKYITIEASVIRENNRQAHGEVVKVFAQALTGLFQLPEQANVLVVGLGNWNATPDALGPRVVKHTLVTRHLYQYAPEEVQEGMRSVSALAPGVLGITGIETAEIIRGVVESIKPELVIAVDALAAGSVERIASSIQLCDTGISPGSGIGNKRRGITEEEIGVPVISVGVPTVVHAALIAGDAINKLYESYNRTPPDQQTLDQIIGQLLQPFGGHLMVTPKEIDELIQNCARIIAGGISSALHPGVPAEEYSTYLH
ncbi:MAG: GPR endopeptidase [Desulforudis sp.]|nr:MAG: GPR endopeptidase [Desulforudis sp.]